MSKCLTDKCDRESFCKGMCEYHYRKSRKVFRRLCGIEGCDGVVVARNLCQKHYNDAYRKEHKDKTWISHSAPLCRVDGCVGKHMAKGLCQKHYSEEIKRVNREFLVSRYYSGGIVCQKCKNSFELIQMDFHHVDPKRKEHSISELLNNSALKSRTDLIAEMDECQKMCARCHQNTHHDPTTSHESSYAEGSNRRKGRQVDRRKQLIREVVGEHCGKCNDWLYPKEMEFHHRDSEMKEDNLSDMFRSASKDAIVKEVEKCDLLCRNCHRLRLVA